MARWPAPGRCKRRLAQEIGAARAAQIQARLTGHTLAAAGAARQGHGLELV
ncbi:glycosyltransferase, partial [Cyanobium sp. A1C-AMD]|nr:glycosyltransferase [Cyanobium sp. A1C-AMD]